MARNGNAERLLRFGAAAALLVSLSGCGADNKDVEGVVIGGPALESCIDTGEDVLSTADHYEFPIPSEVCGLLLYKSDTRIIYMRIGPDWVQVVVNDTVKHKLTIAAEGKLPGFGNDFLFDVDGVVGVLEINTRGNLVLVFTR